ncbi:DUF732 domain-containing protein [Mycobacterium sp. ITM-2016-00316]|uniref:DUF732 domain-containing protein n=1 Tax=Mycobacterium sp. ITM-2016-00316 TaxID=2099695 RepID=UPI0037C8A0F8
MGAGLSSAPIASAGPYCDFFDVAGLCDVRDAIRACSEYPEACDQYSPPPTQQPYEGSGVSATPERDYRFLQAIGSLGSSYTDWPQFLSGMEPVLVGHQVCSALDRGGDPFAPILQAAGDSQYSRYYGNIFAGYAVQHLCPEHTGAVGSV